MKTLLPMLTAMTAVAIPVVAAATVIEPRVERIDAEQMLVTWVASSPVSVYLSYRPDADTSQAKRLSRSDRDGRYVATVTDRKRAYFLLRDNMDGSVARVSERVLPLERGSNFRDLGGYATADGKHVRWGSIYRSGATPLLSDSDVTYIRALGLRSIVDLRSTEERELAPTRLAGQGIQYVAVDYPFNNVLPKDPPEGSAYHESLILLAPQFRAIFRGLLSNDAPLAFNCTAGQDRTGLAAALILSALGVPRAIIMQDYHLSTEYRHPENEAPIVDPAKYPGNAVAKYFAKPLERPAPLYTPKGHALLADTFDEIDTRWGSVDNYLEQVLKIDSAQLAQLRARYLE